MRIALCSEGTYPVVMGGVSTWVDQLITRMPDRQFHVMTLVGPGAEVLWPIPANVTGVQLVSMWAPAPALGLRERLRAFADLRASLEHLWRVVLPPHSGRAEPQQLGAALRRLAHHGESRLASVLPHVTSAGAIIGAWTAHRAANPHLPALTLAEAAEVGRLCDRILAVLDTRLPEVDLVHLASNGPAALPALLSHWEHGTPLVLTEHGIYLRERYLALDPARWGWTVRYAVMALVQSICRLTYHEAEFVAPVSRYNARWERQIGAPESRIVTIPNGVDATRFTPVTSEPDVPTVTFVGRIDPLKDLHTLVAAFALVRQSVPEARLRIFGPTPPGNEPYAAGVRRAVLDAGLESSVTFEGAVDGSRPAVEAGHVVALSSISEGMPFTVIEAMMCGRATVSTDVGGVSEAVGTDGRCGLVVPPRDPETLAAALVQVLGDEQLRAAMGAAARCRAMEVFSLDLFERRFRQLYDVAATRQGGPDSGTACAVSEESPSVLVWGRLDQRARRRRRQHSETGRRRVGPGMAESRGET